jgi:SOS-response transcriptional repressor LexA
MLNNLVAFPAVRTTPATAFRFRVNDDSLAFEGIPRGECVNVTPTDQAETGDLAVVLTPDGRLISFVSLLPGNVIRLETVHPHYSARDYVLTEVKVLGVVRRGRVLTTFPAPRDAAR